VGCQPIDDGPFVSCERVISLEVLSRTLLGCEQQTAVITDVFNHGALPLQTRTSPEPVLAHSSPRTQDELTYEGRLNHDMDAPPKLVDTRHIIQSM
jgi:hypothetical protein